MSTKDLFSGHSQIYAAFRPVYPDALYRFIYGQLREYGTAWDCATGNGQVARHLSRRFEKVYATDISQQQIDNAFRASNIFYAVGKAEQTSFPDHCFDLITVGQALHWLDTNAFYTEVQRVARPGSVLAAWGYASPTIDEHIGPHFEDFYYNTVGPYWDAARKRVENQYRDIPFPFEQIPAPPFKLVVEWDIGQFAGYLTSWSATQKFIAATNADPVPGFIAKVRKHWKNGETKTVSFPLFLKLGRVASSRIKS